MPDNDYQHYYDYLAENVITPFYNKRLTDLKALTLNKILKRKNPYLFKAKNIEIAGDLVKGIVDASLSSGEETVFGNYLEDFAIYVSNHLYGGFKSEYKSVDLEFSRDDTYYIVGIKSGTNWGNSDQIRAMQDAFALAKTILRSKGIKTPIVAVNGCIYGKDRNPFKGSHTDSEKHYYKYAGQEFWRFVSGDDELYREIIKPIDEEARQKDDVFQKTYAAKINEMTLDFVERFTTEGTIDWIKLVDFVSRRADADTQTDQPDFFDELDALPDDSDTVTAD